MKPIIPEEKKVINPYLDEDLLGWNAFRKELLTNLKERGVDTLWEHLQDTDIPEEVKIENLNGMNAGVFFEKYTKWVISAIVEALTKGE